MDVRDFVQRPEAAHRTPVSSTSPANNSQGSLATTTDENGSNEGSSRTHTNDEKKDHSASFPAGDEKALEHVDTRLTTYDQANDGRLYHDGVLVRQPAPSMDPRDPLNLPLTRKLIAAFFLCFFGALAASAELILGAMLPVFALQYANINPKYLLEWTTSLHGLPAGSDPLKTLEELPNAPPIWHVYLLASLPVLMMGVANLILIPLAISIGRRPVVILSGLIAIGGALWAGHSGSLGSHIGARAVQAIGAGTVESLIPFIIQDMVFVHQRNTWISGIFAAQGIIIIALGISAPYIIIYLNWRWVYYMTAAAAGFFLLGVIAFMPETRWHRTRAEMNGVPVINPAASQEKRSFKYDIALTHGKTEWRKGWNAFIDTLRTFFYPQIFFITMLNSAMIACAFAAGYTVAPALLTQPWSWPFLHVGLCLIPLLIAAVATGIVTGYFADWTANLVAKKRGKRVPENQLLNLALPTVCALVGSVIFGIAGEHPADYSAYLFLFALGLMAFGFLGANTIGAVYVLECYPHLAGPALVNIASFRCLIAFVLSFKVSEWVANLGYETSMLIYTGIIAGFALFTPVVWFYGESWRKRWPAERLGDH
ncbi:hypothetical protein M409DRAFT_68115 [Zasmidium cellare ATCC 36951]|uniref:Major facilitator superfamily (MFS) profile domain-containing protein n=1 Tax=Zasmidium cellare ATCC 36951 TaxID=1080233 RepID=A0A6A6CBV3_ZASCE|nr:uncharacterized protein M409DRAFT_68115 [Zasmidium cellare ATCC 36951]KAF2164263.1 hypothetical protein M409DRAFT_68115 [Zasmidium cellare ATCC 36951]